MSDQELKEAARLERNRYYREYRARNRDRVKEINARYWEKKAKEAAEKENAHA